jgi:hypothetical protein
MAMRKIKSTQSEMGGSAFAGTPRLVAFASVTCLCLLAIGVSAWVGSNWLRARTIALHDVDLARLERAAYRLPQSDSPKLKAPPDDLSGGRFAFEYPSMQSGAWPGEVGLMWAKMSPSYQPEIDHFPVLLSHIDYQPWATDQGPVGELPVRPWTSLRRAGSPDLQRQPSKSPHLDRFKSAHEQAEWHRRHPHERSTEQNYIGGLDVPYELLIGCDPSLTCRADVYSERSRFAFTLEFPSEGITHAYDLVEAADRMLVSKTPPGGAVDMHWRDAASNHPAPEPSFPIPPDCTSPAYASRAVTHAIEWPENLATGRDGSLYVLSNHWPKLPVVWRFSPADLTSDTPIPRPATGELSVPIGALAVDADDRLVIASMRDLLHPQRPGYLSQIEPSVFARGLSVSPVALQIDARGNAFYLGVSEGTLFERPPSRIGGVAERLVAHDLARPIALAVTPSGTLYVTDGDHQQIQRIDAAGQAHALPTALRDPGNLTSDGKGNLFVIDNSVASIQRVTPDGHSCAVTHNFRSYFSVAADSRGHIFASSIADGVIDEFSPL